MALHIQHNFEYYKYGVGYGFHYFMKLVQCPLCLHHHRNTS